MNTNAIAKQYQQLTARERFPLIMAASDRGDDAEHDRLVRTAPRVQYRFTDHFPLAMAFRELADSHTFELLAIAAKFWAGYGYSRAEKPPLAQECDDLARMFAYGFKVKWLAWRVFCEERQFNPDSFFKLALVYNTLQLTVKMTDIFACSPEQADGILRENTGDENRRALRVEDEAKSLRECFETRAKFWGHEG